MECLIFAASRLGRVGCDLFSLVVCVPLSYENTFVVGCIWNIMIPVHPLQSYWEISVSMWVLLCMKRFSLPEYTTFAVIANREDLMNTIRDDICIDETSWISRHLCDGKCWTNHIGKY